MDLLIVQPGAARSQPPSEPRDEPLGAPPPLAVEAALIAYDAVLQAYGSRQATVFAMLTAAPLLCAAAWVPFRVRGRAEKRSARRLGVTGATSPVPAGWGVNPVLAAVPRGWARVRGRRPEPVPWWLYASTFAVRAFNRRRSWERAYAAARASQDFSSASSSTSAVCAPDTP